MSFSSRTHPASRVAEKGFTLNRAASRSERGLIQPGSSVDLRGQGDLAKLGERAEQLHAYRARRSRLLPQSLLGEPGWDILLFLFAATTRGETVGTTKACAGSGAPAATALRWIARLSDAGLIETLTSPDDQRLRNLRLTGKGIRTIADILDDSASFRSAL
ncbi:MAG: hypothetical protein ACK4NZ_04325 [Tsuneonella sp.]